MKGYRHRFGLFPPIRTAYDFCPVPHWVRYSHTGNMIRCGVDGVEYPNAGGPQPSAHMFVGTGDWVEFDSDDVSAWTAVISGPFGAPQFITTELPFPAKDEWINTNFALYRARVQQLHRSDPEDERPPRYVRARDGLFGDDGMPYLGELKGGEFIAHRLNGDTESLGSEVWANWVRGHLADGLIVAFDPFDWMEWEPLVTGNGEQVATSEGPLQIPNIFNETLLPLEIYLAHLVSEVKRPAGGEEIEKRLANVLRGTRESGQFKNVPELEMV